MCWVRHHYLPVLLFRPTHKTTDAANGWILRELVNANWVHRGPRFKNSCNF